MSEDIDILIEEKEASLMPLRQRMEQLKQEFLKETTSFTADWYKKTAKQYITKYPEITLHMSEVQIAKMKAEINNLVKDTGKNVRDVLDREVFWWHQKPRLNESIEQYMQLADRYPETLDRGVRQALGFLGVILEEFHFHVIANGNAGSYQEFWFAQAVGSQQVVPCYPHLLKWTEPMQDTIRDYDAVYVKAMAIFSEIQLLKEEKRRQDALSRWDSI